MLHIILLILKILGCILLALLGLLLIILLIVLFVPIKYDISGSYYNSPNAAAKVTWLFGIIKANAEFKEKQFRIQVKLLWKTLFDTQKEKTSEDVFTENIDEQALLDDPVITEFEQSSDMTSSTENISSETVISQKNFDPSSQKDADISVPSETKKESLNLKKDSTKEESNDTSVKRRVFLKKKKVKKEKIKNNGPKIPITEKMLSIIDRFIDKIDDSLEHIEEKIESLSCKLNKIDRFIHAECTQNSIILVKKMLLSIIKHILPRKANGKIHFGLDKPSSTGKILGYASAFYPLYGKSIQLEPDFENKVIEGELEFRGSIQLYIFAAWLLRAVLCKDIRKLIKYIKHLKG